jgi:putative Holliday junction resolvase
MRVLGVDYGQKRIGLAISDPLGIFAQPLETVEAPDLASAADRIAAICKERSVETILVGLPRNMDNTLGPSARDALAFKDMLSAKTGLPTVAWDERLSTMQAERSLRETGLSRHKRQARVNAVAAQVILQSYLGAQKKGAPPQSGSASPDSGT